MLIIIIHVHFLQFYSLICLKVILHDDDLLSMLKICI